MPDDLNPEAPPAPAASDSAAPAADAKPAVDSSTTDAPSSDAKPADSSPADGDTKPRNSFEAVKAVLAKQQAKAAEDGGAAGDPPPPRQSGTQGPGSADGAAKAESDGGAETYEPIKDAKRPVEQRLNKLLEERKEYLAYKERAKHFDDLTEWTASQQIRPEEFVRGMELIALAKSNPKEALKQFEQVVSRLKLEAGVVEALPSDLQDKVDSGTIDEDSARELAAERLQRSNATRRLEATTQQQREEAQFRQQAQQVHVIKSAITVWENDTAKSDPDWKKKRPLVISKLHELVQKEGLQSTPQAAVEQHRRALKEVEAQLSDILPQKQPVKTVTGGSSSRNAGAQPSSSFEAAKLALKGQRASYGS